MAKNGKNKVKRKVISSDKSLAGRTSSGRRRGFDAKARGWVLCVVLWLLFNLVVGFIHGGSGNFMENTLDFVLALSGPIGAFAYFAINIILIAGVFFMLF